MRIIVCGGRDYDDPVAIAHEFAALPPGPHTIVHGACKVMDVKGRSMLRLGEAPGADRLAHYLAMALGWNVEPHPADWDRYGRAAGPVRNRQMADRGAELCIAFPGGSGTASMVDFARDRGIPVREVAR